MHLLFAAALLILTRYQGTWHVTRSGAQPGSKPDLLVNQCASFATYYACQQTVNGQPGALVVFISTSQQGHFYVQNVMPEGFATGRADLNISGDTWTFTNTRDDSGRTIYYRTTNVFSGPNKIHFEQAESNDNKTWKVTGSGDEVKIGR